MLYKRCMYAHKEDNKIGLANLGFFCDFIRILQETGLIHK
jgi:hypothetical protein